MVRRKIFVFGSNLQGIHRSGAAKEAIENYGAVYGQGVGLQGDCYAIPTKHTPWQSMTLSEIQPYVEEFVKFVWLHPEWDFLLTSIGCGLAGHTVGDIVGLFRNNPEKSPHLPSNVYVQARLASWD